MPMQLPAVDPASITPRTSSMYPERFRSRVLPRALGDACGLTRIGVNHTTLMPGKESSMRHWHTHEDEFVFVYLEISNRDAEDAAEYPDVDMRWSGGQITRKDGSPY